MSSGTSGGAIALAACPTVVVEARDTTAANLSLPANVYSQPGFHQAYKGVGEIPFTVLFQVREEGGNLGP